MCNSPVGEVYKGLWREKEKEEGGGGGRTEKEGGGVGKRKGEERGGKMMGAISKLET